MAIASAALAILLGQQADAAQSRDVIEQHWELLGTTITAARTTIEPIKRGSLPAGVTGFSPQPTATLEVAAKITGALGAGGYDVKLQRSNGQDIASVFFGVSDNATLKIKTAPVPWPTLENADLHQIRVTKTEPSPGDLGGTIEVKKAYLKIRQAGTITKTIGRVPIAGKQLSIFNTSWQDVGDVVLYRHAAADFDPAPTVRLRTTGLEKTQNVILQSLHVRLVDASAGDAPIPGAEHIHSALASITSGQLTLTDGHAYKIQVRVDANTPPEEGELYSAELILEQSTTDPDGILKTVGWYPSLTAGVDVASDGAKLGFLLRAPENILPNPLAPTWETTAKQTSAACCIGTKMFNATTGTAASGAAMTTTFDEWKAATDADVTLPSLSNNNLDTQAVASAGAAGRVTSTVLRIKLRLRDVAGPAVSNFAATKTTFNQATTSSTFSASVCDFSPLTWTMSIKNSSGDLVNSSTSSGSASYSAPWTGSCSIPVAASWTWNGKDQLGSTVPDGDYVLTIAATDESGNTAAAAAPINLHLDATAPEATNVASSLPAISPINGAPVGKATTSVSATLADLTPPITWSISVKDASGNTVRTSPSFTAQANGPVSWAWDGKNGSGAIVTDGAYTATVNATDNLSNSASIGQATVAVDSSAPQVVDYLASPDPFSPDENGTQDTTTVSASAVTDATGPISWVIRVTDQDGHEVAASNTASALSGDGISWVWNGWNSYTQAWATDSDYTATLTARDDVNNPVNLSTDTVVDLTPPIVTSFSASPNDISPKNQDGFFDKTTFRGEITDTSAVTWTITITGGGQTATLQGQGKSVVKDWDGKDDTGAWFADGVWTARLTPTDAQGQAGVPGATTIQIDNSKVVAQNLVFEPNPFSPNGQNDPPSTNDSLWDKTTFTASVTDLSPPMVWTLDIKNSAGSIVKTFSGTTLATQTAVITQEWNGKNSAGAFVPDGEYTGVLTVIDNVKNGPATSTTAIPARVDNTKPSIDDFAATPNPFSPNGDDYKEKGLFDAALSDLSTPIKWQIDILDLASGSVRSLPPGAVAFSGDRLVAAACQGDGGTVHTKPCWDGKDTASQNVADGDYLVRLTARDNADNSSVQLSSITVRRTGTPTDETPPTGPITSPTNEAVVSGSNLTITANPTDATGIARVDFYYTSLGRKVLIASDTDGANGWSTTLDTTELPEGRLTINAEYTDSAGSVGNSTCCAPGASVAVTVNNAVPAPEKWVATIGADGMAVGGNGAEVALNTGQLLLGAIDEAVPGRGFTASLGRNYNSASSARGFLGSGWRTSLEDALIPSFDGSVTYLDAGGREQRFAPTTAAGLSATYYNNPILVGPPALSRTDSAINFNWGTASPGAGVGKDNFSVRWTGLLSVPTAGNWTFYSTTDNGARLFIDGNYVIDNWASPTTAEVSGTATLAAGLHEFTMEYFDTTGSASAVLRWAGPGVIKQIVPAANLLRHTGYSSPTGAYLTLVRSADGSFTLKNRFGLTGEFLASGLQRQVVDANGNSIEIARDGQERPQHVCVSAPTCTSSTAKFTVGYDAQGRIATISDATPRTWTYTYDATGRLLRVSDPLGKETTFGYEAQGRLASITDAEGGRGTATYDASGKVISVKDPRAVAATGPATTISYTSSTATVRSPNANAMNPLGAGTTFALGTAGQMLSRTDPLGNITTWTWDTNFNVLTGTDARGKTTTYTYDARGNVTTEKDPLNQTTIYAYDSNNNLTSETDPRGKVTTYTYDSKGNLLSVRNPLGKTTTYSYDSYGQPLTEVDPRGNEPGASPATYRTTFAYDTSGNVTSVTNALGHTTSFSYDLAGNELSFTDPLGNATTALYDKTGNLLSVVDAEGIKITYEYDGVGRRTKVVDPRGNELLANPADYTTTMAYFADGLFKNVTDPLGNVTSYVYDANGNLQTESDPRAKTTTYTYSLNDQLTRLEDSDGALTTYAYDAVGRTTSITDPKGTTSYEYDDAGETLALKGPRLDVAGIPLKTSFTYDPAGNLLTAVEPAGNLVGATAGSYKTTQTYDDANQLVSMKDAVGNTTTYGYDAAGNQTTVADATGATTRYSYDAVGNQTQVTFPGSVSDTKTGSVSLTGASTWTTSLTSTADGTIAAALEWATATADLDLQLLNSSGSVVAEANHTQKPESLIYTGAQSGRSYTLKVIARAFSSNFTLDYSIPKLQTTSAAYDAAGNVLSVTNALGTTSLSYDRANRLKRTTLPDGSAHDTEYFADSEVKRLTDPTGTHQFTYDRSGRLATATDQGGILTSYQYDAASNPISVTRSGGSFSSTFDEQNRLQSRTKDGTASFVYGDKLYLTQITAAAGDVDRQTRDEEGRVLSLELKTGPSAAPRVSFGYAYDAQGNRSQVTQTTTGLPVTVASYKYDGLDRLTEETFLAGLTQKTIGYEYDAQFNRTRMTSPGATTYAYNAAGQLLRRVDTLGKATSFFYDGTGNLTRIVSPEGTTSYSWSADGELEGVTGPSGNVTFTYDALGKRRTKTVGTVTTTYGYEGDTTIDETTVGSGTTRYTYNDRGAPLTITLPSGATYTYHYDAGGSVIDLTDSAHQVAASYSYDAWGDVVDAAGSQALRDANPYTYRGAFGVRFDRETSLYLMGERYYDPSVGRFISRDPGEVDPSHSSYVYALANPVTGLDPTGLFPIPDLPEEVYDAKCAAGRNPYTCPGWGTGNPPVTPVPEPEPEPKPKPKPKPKPEEKPKSKKEKLALPWDKGQWKCVCGYGYNMGGHTESNGGDKYALDFGLKRGQSVRATMSGKVTHADKTGTPRSQMGGWGIDVNIQHKIGSKTVFSRYGHFSKTLVKVGNWVKQGQVIGKAGNTHRSKNLGDHLHFAMFRNGSPRSYKPEPIDGYTGIRKGCSYRAGGGKRRC